MKELLNNWRRFEPPTWLGAAILGIILTVALYFPGHLNGDSKWQMNQALTGDFNTHHPVIMAYLWRILMRILPSEGSIFLFHVTAFWMGLAWLLDERATSALQRGLGVLVYLAYLPLSVSFFTIVKDTGMASTMVLATGALVRYERTRELWVFLIAIVALVYASHVRHNGILAAIPYFFWAGHLISVKKWKIYALGIALVVLLPWRLYEDHIIKPVNGREGQIPLLYDIVAISMAKDKNYVPEFYSRGQLPIELEELRQLYDPDSSLPLFWPRPNVRRELGWVRGEREWVTLCATWLAVIVSEPGTYLAYRIRLFKRLLGFKQPYYWPYWFPPDSEWAAINRWNKPVQESITQWIQSYRDWPIFKSWFYYLALLIMAFAALKRRRRQSWGFGCVLASVFLYLFGLFLMAVDSDFRFSYWAIFGFAILPLVTTFRMGTRGEDHCL